MDRGSTSSGDLGGIERAFAASRRASSARRRGRPARRRRRSTAKAAAVAIALFVFAGGMAAEAHGPAPRAVDVAPVQPRCPIPAKFRRAFTLAARETGVPLALLTAMAHEESEMNPRARSRAGAVGLLQLMPGTARDLDADASDPEENVRAGAAYMARMLERFFENVDLALAGYNAGPAAVAEAGEAPSLETVAYVASVRARAAALRGCR